MRLKELMAEMRELIRERNRLLRCVEHSREMALSTGHSLTSISKDGMAVSKVEDGVLELSALQSDIEALNASLDQCRAQIRQSIDRLPAGMEHTVLRMRYLDYLPASDIARATHYTRPYIYKLLERAENRADERTKGDSCDIEADKQDVLSSML